MLTGRGDRWLLAGGAARVTPGAPEALVYAFPAGKGWRFVGRTGAVYSAASPLGKLAVAIPAPEGLVKIAPLRDHVIAIGRDRRLQRFERQRVCASRSDGDGLRGCCGARKRTGACARGA